MEDKQEEESYGYGRVNNVLSDKCQLQVNSLLKKFGILLTQYLSFTILIHSKSNKSTAPKNFGGEIRVCETSSQISR